MDHQHHQPQQEHQAHATSTASGDHPAAHDSAMGAPAADGRPGAAHGAGHDRHEGHSVAIFRDTFWLSLALTIPVVLLSQDIQMWFGYTVPTFPGS
jgi:Cu2+-exporting ATPase